MDSGKKIRKRSKKLSAEFLFRRQLEKYMDLHREHEKEITYIG